MTTCLLKRALPIWWASFFTLFIACASTAIINVALIVNDYFLFIRTYIHPVDYFIFHLISLIINVTRKGACYGKRYRI